MKKLLNKILPVFMCIFCFAAPVCAESAEDYIGYDFTYPYAVDDAGIINNDRELSDKLEKIGDKYGMDIVVVTVDSLGGKSATAFADDFYDYNGYANDGILFLLSMSRDWAISTKGYGIKAFTDFGCDYIFDRMRSDLSNNNYEAAFNTFAEQCDRFLEQAKKGKPYDTNNKPDKNYKLIFIIGIVSGAVIAVIVTGIMQSQLKSVKFQSSAGSYINNGSVRVTQSNDFFLYKTVSKTRRETQSSSSGGGGSSTHTSSSGSTHGGSSGKW